MERCVDDGCYIEDIESKLACFFSLGGPQPGSTDGTVHIGTWLSLGGCLASACPPVDHCPARYSTGFSLAQNADSHSPFQPNDENLKTESWLSLPSHVALIMLINTLASILSNPRKACRVSSAADPDVI